MSAKLYIRMKEDRALRDAAQALVKSDVAHLRADLAIRGIGARVAGRVGESAVNILDEAVDVAENNRGVLAGLVGALLLWFVRNPVISLFTDDELPDGEIPTEDAADLPEQELE
jgi:hypothetical protein